MKKVTLFALVAATLFAFGEAFALSLTNRDSAEHRVTVSKGNDEAATSEFVMDAEEAFDDLCLEGCVITLGNGAQQSFEGYETVHIQDGQFVVAE